MNESANCIADSWRLLKGLFLCFGILATRKQVNKLFEADLICNLIFLKLPLDIFLYLLFIPPYCIHLIPSCPEMSIAILIL